MEENLNSLPYTIYKGKFQAEWKIITSIKLIKSSIFNYNIKYIFDLSMGEILNIVRQSLLNLLYKLTNLTNKIIKGHHEQINKKIMEWEKIFPMFKSNIEYIRK